MHFIFCIYFQYSKKISQTYKMEPSLEKNIRPNSLELQHKLSSSDSQISFHENSFPNNKISNHAESKNGHFIENINLNLKNNKGVQNPNISKANQESFISNQNLINAINMATVIQNMNKIIKIKPKNKQSWSQFEQGQNQRLQQLKKICHNNISARNENRNANNFGRQKYQDLLKWHNKSMTQIKGEINKQSSVFQVLQKQEEVLLLTLQALCEHLSKQCEEKGLLMYIITLQHINLYSGLSKYMDQIIKTNLTERVEAESKIEADFNDQIAVLKQQLNSLQFEKDKKWKNLFMLIKDNRILRRIKGKLIRELQAATYKNQMLKENILQLTKQNERFKLCLSPEYGTHGLEKWLKNMSSIMKIERYIKKQPLKTKRILQFELQNLQISEMESLPQKIQYIMKAIQEAQQLVDYYEDLNDLIAPCKLLLNNQTQTEAQYEQIGINTNYGKPVNTYCQVKRNCLLENGCRIVPENINLIISQPKNRETLNIDFLKRKASNMSTGQRSQRLLMKTSCMSLASQFYNIHEPNLRIVKSIEETIIPKYVPSSANKSYSLSNSMNTFVYIDSRFMQKLSIDERLIDLSIHGLAGITFHTKTKVSPDQNQKQKNKNKAIHSQTKSKTSLPQKRHSQLGPQPKSLNKQSEIQKNPKNNQHKFSQPNQHSYLQKRYSYNANTVSLQNRLKKQINQELEQQSPTIKQVAFNNTSNNSYNKNKGEQITVNIKQAHLLPSINLGVDRNMYNNRQTEVISQQHSYISQQSGNSSINNLKKPQNKVERNKENILSKQNQTNILKTSSQNKSLLKIKEKIQNLTRHTVSAVSNKKIVSKQSSITKQSNNLQGLQPNFNNTNTSIFSTNTNMSLISNENSTNIKKIRTTDQFISNISVNTTRRQSSFNKAKYKQAQSLLISNMKCNPNQDSSLRDNSQNQRKLQQELQDAEGYQIDSKIYVPAKARFNSSNIDAQTCRNLLECAEGNKMNMSHFSFCKNLRQTDIRPFDFQQNSGENRYRYNIIPSAEKSRPFSKNKKTCKKVQPVDFSLYFQPEMQTTNLSIIKTTLKLEHLLFVTTTRQQLRTSHKTLKQFIQANLKNICIKNSQSQYESFVKSLSLAILQQYEPTPQNARNQPKQQLRYLTIIQCFVRMMNNSTPTAYKVDLLKLYMILLEKSGRENLIVDLQKANCIINYITSIFYSQKYISTVVEETCKTLVMLDGASTNSNNQVALSVNLAQYFLILESNLHIFCLETQFYRFCVQILPQNQADLNFMQISQLVKLLPNTLKSSLHLSQLKLYLTQHKSELNDNLKSTSRPHHNQTSTDNTKKEKSQKSCIPGMKAHKISLYCCRQQWIAMKNIMKTIQVQFVKIMPGNYYLNDLIQLFKNLEKQCFGHIRVRSACPWIYKIARRKIKMHQKYEAKISRTLLMLIWVIEVNLRIDELELLGSNLDSVTAATAQMYSRKLQEKYKRE